MNSDLSCVNLLTEIFLLYASACTTTAQQIWQQQQQFNQSSEIHSISQVHLHRPCTHAHVHTHTHTPACIPKGTIIDHPKGCTERVTEAKKSYPTTIHATVCIEKLVSWLMFKYPSTHLCLGGCFHAEIF